MEFTSRKQTPQDYALVPSSSTKIVPIVNQFQALSDFPPLSYNEALLSPKTPQKAPQKKEVTFYKYFTKNSPIDEVYLTPELSPISQTQLLTYLPQLFADGFNWFTDNLLKNRKFYEFILVDSQSAEIFHTMSKDDPTKIAYSKCKILKVLIQSDWKSPTDLKPFSIPQTLPGYTYQDYKNAWIFTFYVRPFSHSWFFYFDRHCNDNLPVWFYHWWFRFGATSDIFPQSALLAFDYYLQHSTDKAFTRPLRFHRDTGLAWIFCWIFETIKVLPNNYPLSLCRKYKIRWWEKFDLNTLTITTVQQILHRKTPIIKKTIASSSKVDTQVPPTKIPEE